MSRVHCLDCRMPVVVDPQGRCPEGHEVGEPGARIDQAMGSSLPYPDEPEPWVGTVVLDPADRPATAGSADPAPRRPEPAWRPDHGRAPTPEHGDAPTPEHEALLVEFQALGDLGDEAATTAPASPEALGAPPPMATPPAPAPSGTQGRPPSVPTPEDLQDVLAELSALESLASPDDVAARGSEGGPERHAVDPVAHATPRSEPPRRSAVATLDDFDLDDLAGSADQDAAPTTPAPAVGHDDERPTQDTGAHPDTPAPAAPPVDLASFTARGSAGRGGRAGKRRRFGR